MKTVDESMHVPKKLELSGR